MKTTPFSKLADFQNMLEAQNSVIESYLESCRSNPLYLSTKTAMPMLSKLTDAVIEENVKALDVNKAILWKLSQVVPADEDAVFRLMSEWLAQSAK